MLLKEVEIEDASIPRDLDIIILHNGVSDRASTDSGCSQTTMYVPSTNDDDEALKIDDSGNDGLSYQSSDQVSAPSFYSARPSSGALSFICLTQHQVNITRTQLELPLRRMHPCQFTAFRY